MHICQDKAKEIFLNAVDAVSPAERLAYLDSACADDVVLRRNVEELLLHYEGLGSFLQSGGLMASAAREMPALAEGPGTVLGSYKLLEQIGEGGMGLVFMAEQLQPVRRRVALKILKPGMDTRQVVARFEAERQALAMMEHAHIAQVFDAGTTETGRPYFVMELVRGVPITDFCDQHRYTPVQRLELFATVCQAVQHAHQKGIIHRDLKPSNVLVTLHDTVAVPKIIDFGIAKATGQQLTEKTLFTHFAQMIGTPLYMSPEQAEMNELGVDTRSDVYALGVMLYELLTGATPFDSETLKKAGYDEMRRIIREEEPPRPSLRVSTLEAAACTTASERRGVDERRLGQLLRGELDWIVMKSLDKDRNRRYESASALAADVQCYLNDEPVQACPPSAGYRLRKFVRRNRRVVATASAFVIVLFAATVLSAWQAVVARDAQYVAEAAEQRATGEAAIAKAVSDFLQQDLLRQVDTDVQREDGYAAEPNLTVKAALDRAAERIKERFRDQPLVEAAVRITIARAYSGLGQDKHAVPHFDRAFALRKAVLGPANAETLKSQRMLAHSLRWVFRIEDSILHLEQVLGHRQAMLGPEHPLTLQAMRDLGTLWEPAGQPDKAILLLTQVLEKSKATLGEDHPDTIASMQSLGWAYRFKGRLPEAVALAEQALEKQKARLGGAASLLWMHQLAELYQKNGDLDKADRLLRSAIELSGKENRRNLQGPANLRATLGENLLLQMKHSEAEVVIRESLAIYGKIPDEAVNIVAKWRPFYAENLLGEALFGQQKYVAAETSLLQGYEGMKKSTMYAGARLYFTEAVERVVRFYEATHQPEKAQVWREKLAKEKAQH